MSKHKKGWEHVDWQELPIVGIDGEGEGDNPHRYTLLAASDGLTPCSVSAYSLDSYTCLDFLVSLGERYPKNTLFVGFSLSYDWTMILKDLPSKYIYKLLRPSRRKTIINDKEVILPIRWRGFEINMLSSKVSIRDCRDRNVKKHRITIWDTFRFFGCSFVNAVKAWGVRTKDQMANISAMKDARCSFDQVDDEKIKDYCYQECHILSDLIRKLGDAHSEAGIPLKKFYGAGSSGEAMLNRFNAKSKIVKEPEEMTEAVASAFFGGRFERNCRGLIKGEIYDYDISSAYPYAMSLLPCIRCGKWEKTTSLNDIKRARAAVVQARVMARTVSEWGPLPYRDAKGTITYPVNRGYGWFWKDELLAALKHFNGISIKQAWVYNSDCECKVWDEVSDMYKLRLRMGKDGAGLAIKLGLNSCYGKLAQSRGSSSPPFQCWIYAGMITSKTRAMILDMIGLHKDRRNLLSIATDGIKTREKLVPPLSEDLNTNYLPKPLGGWEEKKHEGDIFMVREGIHYLVDRDGNPVDSRARGVGRSAFMKQYEAVYETWAKGKTIVVMPGCSRFHAAKNSIQEYGQEIRRRAVYGTWQSMNIEMSLVAAPKRREPEVFQDTYLPTHERGFERPSQAYNAALVSFAQRQLRIMKGLP